jgi:hypothetical protein
MPDTLATFALRGAMPDTLGVSLGSCFAEYCAWHGQAMFVAGFAQDALTAGVKKVLAERLDQALEFGQAEGIIVNTTSKTKSDAEIAEVLASHQLLMAEQGVKIAAMVMLHNAYDRFLWRLVRFGVVGNRARAIQWILQRNVTMENLINLGVDASVDAHLEKWWEQLERDTMVEKWDRLIGLVGFPPRLSSPPWHFDRKMLQEFDDVRHNAVHHDAQAVKAFDITTFANQLWRAQFVWLVAVASLLRIKIPAEALVRSEPVTRKADH